MVRIEPEPKHRDAARTKRRILAAAQEAFARQGYAQAGIREIAAAAGINSALVQRYFGPKPSLFEAALADALDLDRLLPVRREDFGKHVVDFFLNGSDDGPNPLPMMILASADPIARAIAIDLMHRHIIQRLAHWLGAPDGEGQAVRISILCSGFFTYWKVLPIQVLSPVIDPAMRQWLAASLQAIVDEPELNGAPPRR